MKSDSQTTTNYVLVTTTIHAETNIFDNVKNCTIPSANGKMYHCSCYRYNHEEVLLTCIAEPQKVLPKWYIIWNSILVG